MKIAASLARPTSTVGQAELMRRMLDAMSAYERALIRGRTRAALATMRAKGLKFGSTAPYGWRLNGERLEPDPEEQRGCTSSLRVVARSSPR